jgi:hypothetical protein
VKLLTSPAYALRLYDGLWVWTRFSLPRVPALVALPRVVGLLALAGLALLATRHLRARGFPGVAATRRPGGGRSLDLGVDRRALAAWALVLGWVLALYAMVAFYDGNGGHTHPRYLLPGLAVVAVVAALGLDGLPGARLGWWVGAVVLAQLALTGAAWAGFVTALRGRRPAVPFDLAGAVAGLLDAAGARPSRPLLALAAAALATALALLALALARCRHAGTAAAAGPGPEAGPAQAAGPGMAGGAGDGASPAGEPVPGLPADPGGVLPSGQSPPAPSRLS